MKITLVYHQVVKMPRLTDSIREHKNKFGKKIKAVEPQSNSGLYIIRPTHIYMHTDKQSRI